jgi:Asp-tRNA(Asn)/Glu-tRNA(Gln) amidotransferase A subunit family amidase
MPMERELWRWDAVELAAAIRTRKVSSRETTQSVLGRLDAVNPAINAVTVVLADQALAAADAADAAVKRDEALGPLHGVPVTIKENVDQAGQATTNGVVAFKDLMAKADSPPVANWKRAGAVIIGRTNTPAFSLRWRMAMISAARYATRPIAAASPASARRWAACQHITPRRRKSAHRGSSLCPSRDRSPGACAT